MFTFHTSFTVKTEMSHTTPTTCTLHIGHLSVTSSFYSVDKIIHHGGDP